MAHLRWLMLRSQSALLQLGSQKKKNASFGLKGRPSLGPVPATAFWQSVALTATRRRARPPGVGDFSPLPRPKGSCCSKPELRQVVAACQLAALIRQQADATAAAVPSRPSIQIRSFPGILPAPPTDLQAAPCAPVSLTEGAGDRPPGQLSPCVLGKASVLLSFW